MGHQQDAHSTPKQTKNMRRKAEQNLTMRKNRSAAAKETPHCHQQDLV